jgi:glycosyltransferase involved in cell wall biosynthesis
MSTTAPARTPVSAYVLTRNNQGTVARCLSSLAWCDEVLVVDGGSTDRTLEIARDPAKAWSSRVRVLERGWSGFRDQREYAMREARHDWILVVDSDEECSPELRKRLEELLSQPGGPPHRAYKLRRQEYFLGKPIHHGIWNPSYQDRFFHRQGVRYQNDIHEYPIFPVAPLSLHEPLLHWPDFAPEVFLEKMNKYTSIEARDRVGAGQRTNALRIVTAGPAMFLKNYFYYGAWKDGIHGLVISVLEGISRSVRHVKIWQYQRELERTK